MFYLMCATNVYSMCARFKLYTIGKMLFNILTCSWKGIVYVYEYAPITSRENLQFLTIRIVMHLNKPGMLATPTAYG